MRFAQQPAMCVDGIASPQLDLAISDEFALTAGFAVTKRFKLQQHDIREAVVDLQKIHILAGDACHFECARGGIAEADLERVGARGDVVGGIGVTLSGACDAYRHMRHVLGPFHVRDNDRAGTIGFQAAIVEPERLGYPARRVIRLKIECTAMIEGSRI